MGELAQTVKTLFKARGVILPERFDPGVVTAGKPGDPALQVGSPAQVAQALFMPATAMQIHLDTVKEVSQGFEALIDDISRALVTGWSAWTSSATFAGVQINGPVGVLLPAGMVAGGFMLEPALVGAAAPYGRLPSGLRYASAILGAIGMAFDAWAKGYQHPAIPFPAGALCVGSLPPTPCTPVPMTLGMSVGESLLAAPALKSSMMGRGGPGNHAEVLFDAFSQGFATHFMMWKAGMQLTAIIGAGGVASPLGSPVAGAVGAGGKLVGKAVS